VLSDYTFAFWDGDRLVNIGKAYSGLTDAEIADMTHWFLKHVTRDEGLRASRAEIVLEVAFNNMNGVSAPSERICSALSAHRAVRPDKRPEDAILSKRFGRFTKRSTGDQTKVKRDGQECPSHTLSVRAFRSRLQPSVGRVADYVLELDGGVMDFEFPSQAVVDRPQNRIALEVVMSAIFT